MIKLVENWRSSWKWASVQLSAVSTSTHTLLACVAGGMKLALPLVGVVPLRWVFVAGAVVSVATFIGRLVTKRPKTDG